MLFVQWRETNPGQIAPEQKVHITDPGDCIYNKIIPVDRFFDRSSYKLDFYPAPANKGHDMRRNFLTLPGGKQFQYVMLTLVLIAFAAGGLLIRPKPAVASAQFQNEARLEPVPTAAPSSVNAEPARRTTPVIGILILLAPLVYLAWKSRGVKEPKITAACCLPVIDENKRPFKIEEDLPTPKKSGRV